MCDKSYSGEIKLSHLLTPNKKLATSQCTDATEVQLCEPLNFIGVTYRNVGEGLLTGTETIQNSWSTNAYSRMCDNSQNMGNLQPLHTVFRQLNRILKLIRSFCSLFWKDPWTLDEVAIDVYLMAKIWDYNATVKIYCSGAFLMVMSSDCQPQWSIAITKFLESDSTGTLPPSNKTMQVVFPLWFMTSHATGCYSGFQYQTWILSCGTGLKSNYKTLVLPMIGKSQFHASNIMPAMFMF